MKKKVLISVLIFFGVIAVYCGPYIFKTIKIMQLNEQHSMGDYQDYFFKHYFSAKNSLPQNEGQLKNFIQNNDSLFEDNKMAEYLVKNNFSIKLDSLNERYIIYDFGPNFLDDKFVKNLYYDDTNPLNYWFIKGDVLLFYVHFDFISKQKNELEIRSDSIKMPPNIQLKIDTSVN